MNSYFNEYDKLEKDMAKLVRDIIAERERQGISQGRLAEMAGIKQSAISRIESLRALPQLDTLLRLLRPLNLKLVIVQKSAEEDNIMNIKFENIKELDAEVLSCKLTVTKSQDENFYFITDEEDEFIVEQKGEVAEIRQKKGVFKHIFEKPIEVEVRLPASFSGNAEIVNKNGSTRISNLRFENLEAESDNGRIEIQSVDGASVKAVTDNGRIELKIITADELEAKTDNGKISLEDLKISGNIISETDNGRIILERATAKKIAFKTDNGKISLDGVRGDLFELNCKNGKISANLLGNEDEFSMEISSKSGTAFVGGKKYSGSYIYKDKDKTKHISAQTKNGGINIAFADTDEKYKEKIVKAEEHEDEENIFDFTDLEEFGNIVKNSMNAARRVIKKHIIETDDGIEIHSPDSKEKVVIINKNGKKIINMVGGEEDIKIDIEDDDDDDHEDDHDND